MNSKNIQQFIKTYVWYYVFKKEFSPHNGTYKLPGHLSFKIQWFTTHRRIMTISVPSKPKIVNFKILTNYVRENDAKQWKSENNEYI